jgi:hypothetical protein
MRGRCDLVFHDSLDKVRLAVQQTALALNGALYRRTVSDAMPRPASGAESGNEILLHHVTAVLDDGLLAVDLGDQGETAPFSIECRDSILKVTGSQQALISMTGHGELDKYIGILLRWRGTNSYYDLPSDFWVINVPGAQRSTTRRWQFSQFLDLWRGYGESLTTAPLFQNQRSSAWSGDDYARVTSQDFTLRTDGGANPPVKGASDGSDAGVDITHSRFPTSLPRVNRAESAQRPQRSARG